MIEGTVFDIKELVKVFRIKNGKLERLNKMWNPDKPKWKVVASKVNQSQGYCQVRFNGKLYMYHVILWILFHKENIPEGFGIDHINGNKIDNKIENMRMVTQRENCQNMKCHRGGALVGSIHRKTDKKYRAQISINSKDIYLGYYKTAEEAHEAYETACQHIEEYIDNKSFRAIIKNKLCS